MAQIENLDKLLKKLEKLENVDLDKMMLKRNVLLIQAN